VDGLLQLRDKRDNCLYSLLKVGASKPDNEEKTCVSRVSSSLWRSNRPTRLVFIVCLLLLVPSASARRPANPRAACDGPGVCFQIARPARESHKNRLALLRSRCQIRWIDLHALQPCRPELRGTTEQGLWSQTTLRISPSEPVYVTSCDNLDTLTTDQGSTD